MGNWVKNLYWRFDDTSKNFTECKNCPSRWFKGIARDINYQTSKDGIDYTTDSNKEDGFNRIKLL